MYCKEIDFASGALTLRGTLYLPQKGVEAAPCIIPCSGYQGFDCFYPKLFAQFLTQRGFACLGFDYRGFAESDGEPGKVVLEEQVEDVSAAIEHARHCIEIDSRRIGLLGWGMGSPNVLRALLQHPSIKACAVLNGFYDGERWLNAQLGKDRFSELLARLEKDRERRRNGEPSERVATFEYYPLDLNTEENVEVELSNFHNFGEPVELLFFESILKLKEEEFSAISSDISVLIGHGKNNKLHPPVEGHMLYELLSSKKKFIEIDGGHNDFMYEEHPEFKNTMDTIGKFFQEVFQN